MLSTNNLSDVADVPTARTNLNVDIAGTDNSTNVTLSTDDTTQETLDLVGQEITVNLATETTDGAISAESQYKLNNIINNGSGDSWVSGLQITEHDPKNQTVDYSLGTYLIDAVMKIIAVGGVYDLSGYYSSFTSYQHALIGIYVDGDEIIKSVAGITAEKHEVADLPVIPTGSVCLAIVEIKVDSGATPKNIGNKEIEDCRLLGHFGSDQFVAVSADDAGVGYLGDKISSNGNVVPTIENAGGEETIQLNYTPSASTALSVYYDEELTGSTTTSTSYQTKLTSTHTYDAGTYFIDVHYNWDCNADNMDFMSQVTLDTVMLGEEHIMEIKEKGRTQHVPVARRFKTTLTAAEHIIDIDYKSSDGVGIAKISSASITVTKVEIQ